ncbi:hypothetical protein QLX08_006237 [Tetragonisca angustula]|uniref:Uncharacterized protein n=1 Tax=Tetragonisca angustula TaxID=166442 RepID=A0AAW0ZUY7_9HYME
MSRTSRVLLLAGSKKLQNLVAFTTDVAEEVRIHRREPGCSRATVQKPRNNPAGLLRATNREQEIILFLFSSLRNTTPRLGIGNVQKTGMSRKKEKVCRGDRRSAVGIFNLEGNKIITESLSSEIFRKQRAVYCVTPVIKVYGQNDIRKFNSTDN